jgi:hypothetical protein
LTVVEILGEDSVLPETTSSKSRGFTVRTLYHYNHPHVFVTGTRCVLSQHDSLVILVLTLQFDLSFIKREEDRRSDLGEDVDDLGFEMTVQTSVVEMTQVQVCFRKDQLQKQEKIVLFPSLVFVYYEVRKKERVSV